MNEPRPDPDELLRRYRADEARAARGRLKIFFGASAGVGKTCAMLAAGRQLRQGGADIVIGIVETHGRPETAALLEGLEMVPRRKLAYRGRALEEFDIDAALARAPRLLLVDELAHSNLEGSRHPKRWQDVEELLGAGIDVWSTVNVQHLESLGEIVGGITGIRVNETVPDRVFDAADEVVLVDLPPDELLQRLREGRVYLPDQAERAIRNFFRKGNLIALRELALRRTADRVDRQMVAYRRGEGGAPADGSPVWRTRESLVACIGPGGDGEAVAHSAAREAARLGVPWHAVFVETPWSPAGARARLQVLAILRSAQEQGAETAVLAGQDAAEAIVRYAREHNLTRLLVGRGSGKGMRRGLAWRASFAERAGRLAGDLDVTLVAVTARSPSRGVPEPGAALLARLRAPWHSFALSLAYCALATLVATPLAVVFDLANIAMVFLLAVVVSGVRHGFGPAVAAAVMNVAAFDFFFVPPRFSFAVSDVQYLLTFAVMLAVGLVVAKLMSDLQHQALFAAGREQRMRALYEMARELSGALAPEQIAEICARFATSSFDARAALVLADDDGRLQAPVGDAGAARGIDRGVCQWAFDHSAEAGQGTDTLPGSAMLYVPLRAPMRTRGVLALETGANSGAMAPEQRRLLDTFARLLAIAIERVHFIDVAQQTTVQMESERLRNSLLAAISHDLRTPLSALSGLAETLLLTRPAGAQAEIAGSMREEISRLNSQVGNLLDMARLQAGAVRLNRQWQPLEEVVGSAIASLRAALAGHRVQVDLAADLPLLEFDAVLMERVLANLLENAAKYTPPGSRITIAAAVDGSHAKIRVSDDGPGLPPGREEAIFEKFERGQREGSAPGVGLGLAICRAIVEAHGGSVRATGAEGGGAVFEFTLPLGSPPAIESGEAS